MKEKGDPCILVGYSTQSKGYRVYKKRTRLIVESIHINFDEIKELLKANEPSSSTLVPNVSPPADINVPLIQELEFLFSHLFKEYFTAGNQSVSTSSSLSNNSKQQDTQPIIVIQPTTEPITPTTNVNVEENNNDQAVDAHVDENEFYNIFSTPTKNHLLEQVRRNPSKPGQTRRQLATYPEMCMFALTVSTAEPKNIKEAMADSAWFEAMQDELHQFDRLQVWELVDKPFGKKVIKLKWLWKNKKDEDQTAKYALKILKKHGMDKCESLGTPLATKPKLDADLSGKPVDQSNYRSMIGSLMYLKSSRTKYQLVDMFTKALPENRFQYLVKRIGMRCLTPPELKVLANESA
ncbi:retrovirus-related pol polyprotein from transposon TNT 1-94 [Tanacetum coccineum]